MKCLIVLFAVAAIGSSQLLYSPYSAYPHLTPYSPLTPALRTQYHAQDELGQYSFGYSGGPSSKHESSAGGVTQGAYSYVDAHGVVQSRSYVADPINGFRVAATDIPVDANTPVAAHPLAPVLGRKKRQAIYAAHPLALAAHPLAYTDHPVQYVPAGPADTPEVAAAKYAHYAQYNYESLRNAHLAGRKKRSVYAYAAPLTAPYASVYATPYAVATPTVYHAAPVAPVAAPVAIAPAVSSQYHSQDELGQYSYGYSNPSSSKTETRLANGVTQGGYSYVDAHGIVQSASYVADPAHGFRVAATNLPAAPVA